MANKKRRKIKIDKDHFLRVLRMKNCSIRSLGDKYTVIGRTEKTIRRELNAGEMNPELLNNIAKYLNVDIDYLARKPAMLFGEIDDKEKLDLYYRAFANPDKHPYILTKFKQMDYNNFFETVLTYGCINIEQFQELDQEKRIRFRQDLVVAIQRLIAEYFDIDSNGENTRELLNYYEGLALDINYDSFFAKLEGINMQDDECLLDDSYDESESYFHYKYEV